jgi:large subunit ribosomal protein L18
MRNSKLKFEIRKKRTRNSISRVSTRVRLSVFKSGRHLYAQIIDDTIASTLVSASTLDPAIRQNHKSNSNIRSATIVGEMIGRKASEAGITCVVFDKGGYKYHGVIKALADAARNTLEF